jgi:hypothetical protein
MGDISLLLLSTGSFRAEPNKDFKRGGMHEASLLSIFLVAAASFPPATATASRDL